ncbi:hypothetical protein HDV00_005481 [Rhizophlyctis rosea]|nr:hypothetical protein HDV00_005481 [Rhizophlyctis rosea]
MQDNLCAFANNTSYIDSHSHDADGAHSTKVPSHHAFSFTRFEFTMHNRISPSLVFGISDDRGWDTSNPVLLAEAINSSTFRNVKQLDTNVLVPEPAVHDIIMFVIVPPHPKAIFNPYKGEFEMHKQILKELGNNRRVLFVITHEDKLLPDQKAALTAALEKDLRPHKDSTVSEGMWNLINALVRQKAAGLRHKLAQADEDVCLILEFGGKEAR